MNVQSNTVARSHNIYTSSAILTAWNHFTLKEHFNVYLNVTDK
jgi:hypothetical protein